MAWIVTNPAFFTKFDNGSFEGTIGANDAKPGVVDGFASYQFSNVQFHDGASSFRVDLSGSPSYTSSGNNAQRHLVLFRFGNPLVAGRRYTINGWVRIENSLATVAKPTKLRIGLSGGAFPVGSAMTPILDLKGDEGSWKQFTVQIIAPTSFTLQNSYVAFTVTWDKTQYLALPPTFGARFYFDQFTVVEESNQPPPVISLNYDIDNVSVFGGSDGAIDITGVNGGTGPYTYLWDDGATTQDRIGIPAGSYTVTVVDTATTAKVVKTFQITQPAAMSASFTKTDTTTNGGSDGTITVTVNGGSGFRSFLWDDGETTQNRSGLMAGDYSVTITDLETGEVIVLNITITDPVPTNVAGTILDVPQLNSIRFVVQSSVDTCDNPQNLDNVLFCEQKHPFFTKSNYYQKVQKCDAPILQFNSDFPNFEITLKNYGNGAFVKAFSFELKEQNIGLEQDFDITIRNHTTPGKSRVYFVSGAPPIPLKVNDPFEILNNLDGFDGNYLITDIINDQLLGYQYLVINMNYAAPNPTSPATGRFNVSTANFNVFESGLDMVDVPDGLYYVLLRAIDTLGNTKDAVSEPIHLKVEHENTNLLEGRNFDNAFGMTWTTGYITRLRVESVFFKRIPGGERSVSRNSDWSLVKVTAKKQRIVLFETYMLPPYLHEMLSVFFDLDYFSVNKQEFQATEGYGEPQYITRYKLANSSIKLEMVGWFGKYNSDDIGSVNDGGFIIANEGFIKR